MKREIFINIFLVCIAVSMESCNIPSGAMDSPESTQNGSGPTPTASVDTTPEHRIGVRIIEGVGEFYDRVSGLKFTPRGMNYVHTGTVTKADGQTINGHDLFDPGRYNSQAASTALAEMHADGYNTVRVFLSPDASGTESDGLSAAYMDDLVDFLGIASANDMYVIFTTDWIPGGKYGGILNQDCCSTFALMNANFLPPAGLKANQVFFQDFAREFIKRRAPIEYILSYELRNEMFYDGDQPPLSFTSGEVTTANGKTYDMAKAADRESMLEENNVFWLDSVRSAILEVDPTALVSVGFFHPQLPNRSRIGDPRIAITEPAIWNSALDFIDLHAYPGFELTLPQYLENFGLREMKEKPVIMGEFGGEVKRFDSLETAAYRFVDWQVKSCDYGFDGWIFWTWDMSEQSDFFNARMGDGQIEKALAPVNRPDPCSP